MNASKIVLYEDAGKKQFKECISALQGCEMMVNACSSLSAILGDADSRLLHYLIVRGMALIKI